MRAYQLPKGGAGIDALVKVEQSDPKPSYRQVLVKIAACSLNFRDLSIVRGSYRMPVRDNLVPLSDGAGEVIEVGPGVTRVKVGDKVAGNFFQRWPGGEAPAEVHTSALGGGIDGMLAEYVVLEEEGVVQIPVCRARDFPKLRTSFPTSHGGSPHSAKSLLLTEPMNRSTVKPAYSQACPATAFIRAGRF